MNQIFTRLNESTTPSPLTFGAIGDAYGFCFEFVTKQFVLDHNDLQYHQHPKFPKNILGAYSDDTQMQLALAELMLSDKEWTPYNIVDTFLGAFKRDPREGYAKGFRSFLLETKTAHQFLQAIRPTSDRNGACMRAPVIGLLSDITTIKHHATIQAKVTHDTPGGVDSAVAAALMSHYFVYDLGDKAVLEDFLNEHVPGNDWSPTWTDKVRVHGLSTVQAALTVIANSNSLSEILRQAVDLTGDVDSVATIACACASSSTQFRRDIPEVLWEGLEPSEFGFDFLRGLHLRLVSEVAMLPGQ